jgi:hypothetical protein
MRSAGQKLGGACERLKKRHRADPHVNGKTEKTGQEKTLQTDLALKQTWPSTQQTINW